MALSFDQWIKSVRGISDSSVEKYLSAIKKLSKDFNVNILTIDDTEGFVKLQKQILRDPDFISLDSKGNRMYSVALNHYEKYLRSKMNWLDIIIESLMQLDGEASLDQIYSKVKDLYPSKAKDTYQDTIRASIYKNSSDSSHFKNEYGLDIFYTKKKGSGVWGLRDFQSVLLAEEDDRKLKEGTVKTIKVNAYERNIRARKECINFYGSVCIICEADFSKIYGDKFEGFIHVHHLVPLSDIGEEYVIDPIKDLRPVCPNCHSIIHKKKDGIYSIEEVKNMIHRK